MLISNVDCPVGDSLEIQKLPEANKASQDGDGATTLTLVINVLLKARAATV